MIRVFQITAPHFTAGGELENANVNSKFFVSRAAPIISYMAKARWSEAEVKAYCGKKRWSYYRLPTKI